MKLTLPEAAKVAGIDQRNLRRWLFDGRLAATKPDGLHWEIDSADLMAALANFPATGRAEKRGRKRPGAGRPKAMSDNANLRTFTASETVRTNKKD